MPNGNHFIACTGLKHDLDGDRVEVVPQDVGKIEPPFLLLFFLLSLRFLYFYTTSVTVYLIGYEPARGCAHWTDYRAG